jgi:hypothetical protein
MSFIPLFVRLRILGIRLARTLRRSLLTQSDSWTIEADRQGRPIVSAGPFRILIDPRRLRLFDAIHLYCDDTEIWLPLIARIRLRSGVRLFLLNHAHAQWLATELAAKPKRPRRRQEQPA